MTRGIADASCRSEKGRVLDPSAPTTAETLRIECRAAGGFEDWLAQTGGALAVSTYQAGKVALIGWNGRQLSLLLRAFDKPLGLAVEGRRMALATRHGVHLFANDPLLAPETVEGDPGRYDAVYLPRATYHTGDLNTHDIAFCGADIVVVNTRFSCLARLSSDYNFQPFWRPKFISDCVPEDRCHLNGLAIRDGRPRYVTALGMTDQPGAWRPNKAHGGLIIDVDSGETIVAGLSMPHSPRWRDGRLWALNSGRGELLSIDAATGASAVVCRLPAYLRGLCFVGSCAVVGMCKIREKHIFGGLPVQQQHAQLLCGLAVVDLRAGQCLGTFEFQSGCEELYDVQFLPGVRRPTILNLERPQVWEAMSCPESSFWLRPSKQVPIPAAAVEAQAPSAAVLSSPVLTATHPYPESGASS